jgi:branched-chain amino acid transport system substrate-binding protein
MGSVKLAGRVAAALTVVALVAAGCGSSSKKALTSPSSATGATSSAGPSASTGSKSADIASAPGVTATTIKIGLLTSITGAASSTFSTSALGAKAYFDAVNKAGGIDGRQIQLVTADDLSSPSGALTATEDLIRQGVFAIISVSSFFYGAYRAAQKAGIPVLGGGFDGPEWGQKPNTNMFAFLGGVDPDHSVVGAGLAAAEMFKSIGVHNVAGLAYGISPSSISSVQDLKTAVGNIGLKMGLLTFSWVVWGDHPR